MEFCSRHALSREVLFERESVSHSKFLSDIKGLRLKQRQFAALDVKVRVQALLQVACAIEENKITLARLICEEVGRCLHECEAELNKSVALIHYYAETAPAALESQSIATKASASGVCFEPLGVVFAVMPWNYPVWQPLRFAIPALLAGNACYVKPAPSVGRITQYLFDLLDKSLPLAIAWLSHEQVENAMAAADAFAFTGSSETGRHLAALAGRHLKKSVLELGGSNAFLVLEEADLELAASDISYSRFRDAGQSCNAAKRLIVHEKVADELVARLQNHLTKWQMGDPLLPATTLAPLHREDLRDKLHEQVRDALKQGALCVAGGFIPRAEMSGNQASGNQTQDGQTMHDPVLGRGFFYPATLLDKVNRHCRVYHEEVFGPVASVIRVASKEEAVQVANDTRFGLGAAIYSENIARAREVARQMSAGSVFINRYTGSDVRLPFGGVKDSGFGRELSTFGLYEFVNIKSYWER